MAGAGAKKFPAFSKLTSDDVNNYLADQVVMRFATTTARDAAFGGVGEPTLAEGMCAYIDADNSIYTYDGSNWVKMVSTTDRESIGLWRVTTCTVTSVGGTSATASNGVVTIGTGNTSISVANAFSTEYDNYRIIISGGVSSGGSDLSFQLSGISTSSYQITGYYMTPSSSTITGYSPAVATSWLLGSTNATRYAHEFDVISPNLAQQKFMLNMVGVSTTGYYNFAGHCTSTLQSTGFTLIPNGGTTLTGGTVRVYGYRN